MYLKKTQSFVYTGLIRGRYPLKKMYQLKGNLVKIKYMDGARARAIHTFNLEEILVIPEIRLRFEFSEIEFLLF